MKKKMQLTVWEIQYYSPTTGKAAVAC